MFAASMQLGSKCFKFVGQKNADVYLFGNDFDLSGIEINPRIPATLREFPSATPQSLQDLKAFVCNL